jgi:SAM-dependent methyltransferase
MKEDSDDATVRGSEDRPTEAARISSDADRIERAFAGESIYGDDFTPDEILAWFKDEAEAYADLGAKDAGSYRYRYHAMNRLHGYGLLPRRRFARALGFGSAYGDELKPVIDRIDEVTIVDPSDAFVRTEVGGRPARWVKPRPNGVLDFPDETFDLLTCFGVLHHIPNVSRVLGEFHRVLAPGGLALIREPITSMGDWRRPRPGLTRRERGLPSKAFREAILRSGFGVRSMRRIGFGPLIWALGRLGVNPYSSATLTRIDHLLAGLSTWNDRYHARPGKSLDRVRPTVVFAVLERPATEPDATTSFPSVRP